MVISFDSGCRCFYYPKSKRHASHLLRREKLLKNISILLFLYGISLKQEKIEGVFRGDFSKNSFPSGRTFRPVSKKQGRILRPEKT
jgi:hypothetical protein